MGLGKWILTGLGWSLMGPIGGIIGYLIGNSFENKSQKASAFVGGDSTGERTSHRYVNTGSTNDLSMALLVLMAAVMKADSVVKKSELEYVKRFLNSNFEHEQAQQLLLMLRDIQKQDFDLGDVCRQIKYNTDYSTRYQMLDFLFGIGGSDGDLSQPEVNVLTRMATYLGINKGDQLSIHARHVSGSYKGGGASSSSSKSNKDPYKVLGLDSDASDDEIKKAYRRLAMKYHPDKVEGLGEEMKKNAEAQFREINEAYETLKSVRGIK